MNSKAHQRLLRRDRKRVAVIEYLSSHPCVDCGTTDVRVLDFDHRDSLTKLRPISTIVNGGGWSLEYLLREISKCDVRCANCHRIKTHGDAVWALDPNGFRDRFQSASATEAARQAMRSMAAGVVPLRGVDGRLQGTKRMVS